MTDDAAALTEAQVVDYLLTHPDVLLRHPEVAQSLDAPARPEGGGRVADLQQFMIERLRRDLTEMRDCAEHLIGTQRVNMSLQTRTHDAVLAILASRSEADLVQILGDQASAFDLDVIALCLEPGDAMFPGLAEAGILRLPRGTCEELFGDSRDVVLRAAASGDPALFGAAAGLVRSYALTRLPAGDTCPPGLLALGSRHERTFHQGQGSELLTFLTRVVTYALHRWFT